MAMRRIFMGLFVLVAVPLGGCYTYTPLNLEEVSPLHEVRARVSLAEAERLEELVGRERRNPRMVEGIVAERSNETLSMDMSVASELAGARVQTFRQRVEIPVQSILEVERKELDRGRTLMLTGAVGAVLAAAVFALVIDEGGDATRPGGPIDLESRLPAGGW